MPQRSGCCSWRPATTFPTRIEFRDHIAAEWGLNLVNVIPKKTVQQQESELGILYRDDPAKCCQLRKVEPLMASLEPFEIWFTGLRREQSPTRKNLKKDRAPPPAERQDLLKVSPLADWTWAQVWEYTGQTPLSYLPQYDRGTPASAASPAPRSRRSGESAVRPLERKKTGMRHSHVLGESGMTHLVLGFLIALAVGLTGIGGGSFTVPALLLIVGLPAGEAVGTAFVFAGVLRLIAAPFYLAAAVTCIRAISV